MLTENRKADSAPQLTSTLAKDVHLGLCYGFSAIHKVSLSLSLSLNGDLSIQLSGESDTRQAAEMFLLQEAQWCLVVRDGFPVGPDGPPGSGGRDASLSETCVAILKTQHQSL